MEYSIIDDDERHLAGIEKIEKACFSMPWTVQQIQSQLPDDTHIFIVAVDENDAVIGYVGAMYVLDEGYISNVAVSPEYRRNGIGDALIERLADMAETRCLSFLTLEVRESNAPARALYAKHGFSDVGVRKNYYEKPRENAILMTLFLK